MDSPAACRESNDSTSLSGANQSTSNVNMVDNIKAREDREAKQTVMNGYKKSSPPTPGEVFNATKKRKISESGEANGAIVPASVSDNKKSTSSSDGAKRGEQDAGHESDGSSCSSNCSCCSSSSYSSGDDAKSQKSAVKTKDKPPITRPARSRSRSGSRGARNSRDSRDSNGKKGGVRSRSRSRGRRPERDPKKRSRSRSKGRGERSARRSRSPVRPRSNMPKRSRSPDRNRDRRNNDRDRERRENDRGKDAARDPVKGGARDPIREPLRDAPKDVPKDTPKVNPRDAPKDAPRDSVKDNARDNERDRGRDRDRDRDRGDRNRLRDGDRRNNNERRDAVRVQPPVSDRRQNTKVNGEMNGKHTQTSKSDHVVPVEKQQAPSSAKDAAVTAEGTPVPTPALSPSSAKSSSPSDQSSSSSPYDAVNSKSAANTPVSAQPKTQEQQGNVLYDKLCGYADPAATTSPRAEGTLANGAPKPISKNNSLRVSSCISMNKPADVRGIRTFKALLCGDGWRRQGDIAHVGERVPSLGWEYCDGAATPTDPRPSRNYICVRFE